MGLFVHTAQDHPGGTGGTSGAVVRRRGAGNAVGAGGAKAVAGEADTERTDPQGFPDAGPADGLQSGVFGQGRILPESSERSEETGRFPEPRVL